MVNPNLGKHGIVLDLRFSQRRAVVGDYNQLPFGVAKRTKNGLVTEIVLAALHDESEPVVDALMGLLSFLGRHHCWS